jgi:hypothetical protein
VEVEENLMEVVQEDNVCWSGQGEAPEEVIALVEAIVRDSNCSANDSDDDELDTPLAVDAAQENEAPVEDMELENEEYIALVVEDQDTTQWDKETNVPDDWTTISMSRLRVNDGLDAHWRYDCKQVQVGQIFHDKDNLQDAVKRSAFLQRREFRVKISNRTTYDVKCTRLGCP